MNIRKFWIWGNPYQCRTTYLDRILQALYRIRPDLPGVGERCAFLEQVQETGAELKKSKIFRPDAILQSNAYFGQILRESGVSSGEFTRLILERDLFPIAVKLGLSLYETASLLFDIRSSEGIFAGKHWQPALLDFWGIDAPRLGPAARNLSLSDWRTYAGAFKRAKTPVAYGRARKAGRKMVPKKYGSGLQEDTILDDWFSENELNKPRGCEIYPVRPLPMTTSLIVSFKPLCSFMTNVKRTIGQPIIACLGITLVWKKMVNCQAE